MGRRRTGLVVGAGVVMLVAAAVTGGLLLNQIGDRSGTTWDDYRADSRGLLVHVRARPCDDLDVRGVREQLRRVEVTVVVESGGLFCTGPVEERRLRVGLDDRLGRRTVYDGTCLAEGGSREECARDGRAQRDRSGGRDERDRRDRRGQREQRDDRS